MISQHCLIPVCLVVAFGLAVCQPEPDKEPDLGDNVTRSNASVIVGSGVRLQIDQAAVASKVANIVFKNGKLSVSLDESQGNVVQLENDIRALNRDVDTLGAELQRMHEIDAAAAHQVGGG